MKYGKIVFGPEAESRFEERQRALGRRPDTASTEEAPALAAAPGGSPLSAAEREAAESAVLGFDSLGGEVKIGDFRKEGFGIFHKMTSPGPTGRALMNAFCSMPNSMALECEALGLTRERYAECARYALAAGMDPEKSIRAELDYRRAHNKARLSTPFGPAIKK